MQENMNEHRNHSISKVWVVADTARLGFMTAFALAGMATSAIAIVAPHRVQYNLDMLLQNVIGEDVVNYIMIIFTIIALAYLALVTKSGLVSDPYLRPKVIRQADHAVMYPVIFELALLFVTDLYKSVVATIILTACFGLIVLNGIFIVVMIEYIIRQSVKD